MESTTQENTKSIPGHINQKLQECVRVMKIIKKPAKEEYTAAIKISGAGIMIIGAIGLAIYIIAKISGYIPGTGAS